MEYLSKIWPVNDSKVFWNPDMNIYRDLMTLIQLCGAWAISFTLLKKWVMNPLACYCIPTTTTTTTANPSQLNNTNFGRRSPVLVDGGLRQRKRLKVANNANNGKPNFVPESVSKLRHKFVTSLWKFISYTFFVAYGLYAIKSESSWFWAPNKYHVVFPKGSLPRLLYWYYQLETSYYVFSIGLMAWEPKMKDKAQMFVHHLVTLTLLSTSYVGRMIKFGVPIMLLHDAADPLMEIAKMFLYCNHEMAANASLAAFTVTFMYLRNWVFPRHIIWAIYKNTDSGTYPYYNVTLGSLCTLALLHVYWAGLILKIGYCNFVVGETTGDIREEEEEDDRQ